MTSIGTASGSLPAHAGWHGSTGKGGDHPGHCQEINCRAPLARQPFKLTLAESGRRPVHCYRGTDMVWPCNGYPIAH